MEKRKVVITGDQKEQKVIKEAMEKLEENDIEVISENPPHMVTKPPPYINDIYAYVNDIYAYDEIMKKGLTKKQRSQVTVPVRTEPKIQRNALCPCGSGIKFKKCCL